jgi:hypothetical protein
MKKLINVSQIQSRINFLPGYKMLARLTLLLFVSGLLSVGGINSTNAQAPTLICRVDPLNVAPAGEAILHLEVLNVQDLVAYELELRYDPPRLIEVIDSDANRLETNLAIGDFLAADKADLTIEQNEVDMMQGKIRLKVLQVDRQQGHDGSGELARARIRGIDNGRVNFTFVVAKLWNSQNSLIPVTITGCAFQIGAGIDPTATPTDTPVFTPTPTFTVETPTPVADTPTPDFGIQQDSPVPTPTDTPTPFISPPQQVSPLPTPFDTPTPFIQPLPTPVARVVVATPVDPLAGLEMFPGTPVKIVVAPLAGLEMFPDGPTKTPVPFEVLSPPRLEDAEYFETTADPGEKTAGSTEALALAVEQPLVVRSSQVEQVVQPGVNAPAMRLPLLQLGWLALIAASTCGVVAWWLRRPQA